MDEATRKAWEASPFGRVHQRAEETRRNHEAKEAERMRRHFEAHPELIRNGVGGEINPIRRGWPTWWKERGLWDYDHDRAWPLESEVFSRMGGRRDKPEYVYQHQEMYRMVEVLAQVGAEYRVETRVVLAA